MSALAPELSAAFAEIVAAIKEARGGPAAVPRWLTPAEAEAYSGMPESLIRRLVKARLLPAFKYRGVRVDKLALDAFTPELLLQLDSAEFDSAKGGGTGGIA